MPQCQCEDERHFRNTKPGPKGHHYKDVFHRDSMYIVGTLFGDFVVCPDCRKECLPATIWEGVAKKTPVPRTSKVDYGNGEPWSYVVTDITDGADGEAYSATCYFNSNNEWEVCETINFYIKRS